MCFGEFRSDNMQKVTLCLAVAGRGGAVQLPGHDAVLSPGNPNVGHTPSGSARRQRESHTLFISMYFYWAFIIKKKYKPMKHKHIKH